MFDSESGETQQELTVERRTRKKKLGTNVQADGALKHKSGIRTSRDRLSFDYVERNEGNLPKKSRMRDDNNYEGREQKNSSAKKQRTQLQRLPRSVSEEVLALEGRFNPESTDEVREPKQKRTRATKNYGRDRSDTEPVTPSLPPSGRRQANRPENRKKKKPRSVITSGDDENYQGDMDGEISDFFPIDKEDIIQASELNQSNTRINTITAPPTLPSQPVDNVFIEMKDGQGFIRENRNRMHRASQGRNDYAIKLLEQQKEHTTLDFILTVHHVIRSLAMIGHGLLAGIAVSQCVFVYSLNATSDEQLLETYHQLALPYQSVYYLLLSFSTVSILDRYMNISSGWGPFFLRLLSRPSRALALVAYLFALVFSVSLTQLDDKISLYKQHPSLWATPDDMDQLGTWKIINLMRVIGSVIGWFMVAIAPDDDQTAGTIQQAILNEEGEKDKYEMTSIHTSVVTTWDRVNNINT